MTEQHSISIKKEAAVATLTFNRPQVQNAINTETLKTAFAVIQDLQLDRACKVVIITGAGKAFIAGADISEMRRQSPAEARLYSELGHRLMHTIASLDKPVIAAILLGFLEVLKRNANSF